MSDVLYSVIVPCARPDRIPRLLEALARQTVDSAHGEIIVTTPRAPDGFSSPPGWTLVWRETRELFPPGRMRNLGAACARGRILFFIDDDCLPPPDWMETLMRRLDTMPNVAVAGCRVVSTRGGFWPRCADYVLFSATQPVVSGYRHLGAASLAVRAEAFRQAEGFDETLLASEDWDFGLRLESAGGRSYFDAGIAVGHDHDRGRLGAILKQSFRSGWLSGLTVQRRHGAVLGPAARLANRFSRPGLYLCFGLPYALAMTAWHAWEMRGVDRQWPLFLPFLAAGRMAYQFGVWRNLRRNRGGGGG